MVNGITANCIERVLEFSCNGKGGTCFSYEHNGDQYLITAKHIFGGAFPSVANISVRMKFIIKNITVDIHYHSNPNVDIAVMKLPKNVFLTPTNTIKYDSIGIILGQDTYFLGYPSGIPILVGNQKNSFPCIKKACVSGIFLNNGANILFLDGINNKGFSGGPVCFQNNDTNTYTICAVISGYNASKLYVENDEQNNVCKNRCYVNENTGIIVATDIKHAIEIITSI